MAAYEVLLLNTAIPQIQAAQSGDTYVVPRDIAINATAIISANSATDALRITQTGAGNAILVEDSANPDATPFVVTAAGDVGIGTASPVVKFQVKDGTDYNLWVRQNGGALQLAAATDANATTVAMKFNAGSFSWKLGNSATQALDIDSSGNLGLGVTPSAWSSTWKAFQISNRSLAQTGAGAGDLTMVFNGYFDSTDSRWEFQGAGDYAARYSITGAGVHSWHISTAAGANANDPITFTQAMTLDALGNLVVADTTAAYTFSGRGNITIGGTTGSLLGFRVNSVNKAYVYHDGTDFGINNQANGFLSFATNATERARITSGGDLLVGTTSGSDKIVVEQSTAASASLFINSSGTATAQCVNAWHKNTTGDNVFLQFFTEASATSRGSISYNRTAGLVAYNTTSDYRAKDILGPLANSGATIDALKVYEGKMKGATQSRPMLVAHEAQEVAPYAVTGEKDAVNEDGTPKYQQMDVSSLVPLLLAEIQSLRARVKALEGA